MLSKAGRKERFQKGLIDGDILASTPAFNLQKNQWTKTKGKIYKIREVSDRILQSLLVKVVGLI